MAVVKQMIVLVKLETGTVHQVIINKDQTPTLMFLVAELCGGKVRVAVEPLEGVEIKEPDDERTSDV
jgi:hypothetical protein